MERKIGEIFEFGGEWYQCVRGDICTDCAFAKKHCNENPLFEARGSCKYCRKDATSVIFKKLEKIGEPIIYMSRTFQKLKSSDTEQCKYCYFRNQVCNPQLCGKESFLVEIKQNKENMGEKKLNLKPFDIQKAREGKPVCTRDGRKARIICFDAEGNKPLIVLSKINGQEVILRYTKKGQSDNFHSPTPREDDLMMLPEKKEGWVKIRKDINLYNTKEDADRKMIGNDEYVTAKVCFEEQIWHGWQQTKMVESVFISSILKEEIISLCHCMNIVCLQLFLKDQLKNLQAEI